MKYVGQTGGPFWLHFKEHFRDYKYANSKSKFEHLLENGHSFGQIDGVIEVMYTTKQRETNGHTWEFLRFQRGVWQQSDQWKEHCKT
jgi:hypothetical protein